MKTYHIHIKGIVQGVGFRPFVYRVAKRFGLLGSVNNGVDGVHLVFNAKDKIADEVMEYLLNKHPVQAKITNALMLEVQPRVFKDFAIIESQSNGNEDLLLTGDFAICSSCRDELLQESDRRWQYPFITCTNCGPRYSIIADLPYDRETTTMRDFEICVNCKQEYLDPLDRRFYSQTNSCHDCAIKLSLWEQGELNSFTDLSYIAQRWEQGKIIAIKGIGGYLLTCDASNKDAIMRLRKRKNRVRKPFALMYPDIEILKNDVWITDNEKEELCSTPAPIVLLKLRENRTNQLPMDTIAPGHSHMGVMLAYTPLFVLLLRLFGKPIIATSGNPSNSNIIFDDEMAIRHLPSIADLILTNDRDILIPQDDSVVKFTRLSQQKIMLRRSRGYAPSYINPKLNFGTDTVLAMGAMLKSSFTILHNKNTFISQYLNNTNNYEAELSYRHVLNHFRKLLHPQFDAVLIDKHPAYFTSQFGRTIAKEEKINLIPIQHHEAHFYAVLGEHGLWNTNKDILGVVWDGTGYGDDGQIWGGEFFKYANHNSERIGHIDYFNFILGDKMPKEPRISAMSLLYEDKENLSYIKDRFSTTEWNVYLQLLSQKDGLKTSSMGRIFDAVAALLLDINTQEYEGEAAMMLEEYASQYIYGHNDILTNISYLQDDELPINFTRYIISNIINDIQLDKDKTLIAARFHITLAHFIKNFAIRHHFKAIAFSGGVFQNACLVDLIQIFMGKGFKLYFHKEMSPNDENISFGQLMYYTFLYKQ